MISESARANLLKNSVRCRIHESIFFLNHGVSDLFGHIHILMQHIIGPTYSPRHCETPDCGCVKQPPISLWCFTHFTT